MCVYIFVLEIKKIMVEIKAFDCIEVTNAFIWGLN